MATQILTRILNKIDSYQNWIKEGAIVLKKGEIGIAEIVTSDNQLTPPAIGIKVGDGNTPYAQLPWIQAIAGDVSSFVKESLTTKEAFDNLVKSAASSDVSSLNEAINGLKNRVDAAEGKITTLEGKASTLEGKVSTLEGTVAGHTTSIGTLSTNVTNLSNNKADKTQVASDIAAAKTELIGTISDATTAETIHGALNAAQAAANKADAADAKADTNLATAKTYAEGQAAAVLGKDGDAATVKTVYGAHAAAAAAASAASTNAGEISAIKEDIAEINEALGGTDGNSVSDRLAALEQKDIEHGTAIGNNADAIDAEKERAEGVEAGFETRIATMENFWKAADDPVGTIDKLSEIVDYISRDEQGAIDMAADIEQNTKDIAANTKAISDEVTNRNNAIDAAKTALLGTGAVEGTDTIASVKTAAANAASAASTADGKAVAAQNAANTAQAAAEAADAKADANLATAKTYAEGQAAAVLGQSTDNAEANTVYGAKAAATAVKNNLDKLTGSSIADANGVIETIGFSDGKLTATRKLIDMDDMDPNATFVFYCGTASEVV